MEEIAPEAPEERQTGEMPGAADAATLVCPYLISVAGPWRSAEPAREHRCSRLSRSTHLDVAYQRRYCLGSGGAGCPHHVTPRASGRFVPMLPVVVDRGPLTANLEQDGVRRIAAPATVVIVGAALGALFLARGPGAPGPTSTAGTVGPTLGASSRPSSSSAPSGPAATAPPSPSPAPLESAPPSSAPRPSASPATAGGRTYAVRPGDTLGAIAARFGTTTRVLVQLNGIANPSLIHAGEVLKLP